MALTVKPQLLVLGALFLLGSLLALLYRHNVSQQQLTQQSATPTEQVTLARTTFLILVFIACV